jgi:aspartate aminotransferase
MSERISKKIAAIAESATLKVDAKAKSLQAAGRPVISYAAGEPDFPTPAPVSYTHLRAHETG